MGWESKAAVLTAQGGGFEVREFGVAEPGPGEFVVKVDLAGICGTDVHVWHGHMASVRFPIILGHEITGTVVALGDGVTHDYLGRPVAVGDRVCLSPGVSCGRCYACTVQKTPGRCAHRQPAYGFAPLTESGPHCTGGYSQYLHAQHAGTHFFKTDLPANVAVLLEPIACSLHGVDRAGITIGDTVVVQGTGIIGLGAILCAHLAGAQTVVAVGGPKGRLDLAKRLGADHTIDIAEVRDPADRLALVREYVGSPLGANRVIECAGVPAAFLEAIDYVADGGTVSELGHFTDNGTVTFNPHFHLLRRNLNFVGVFGSGGIDKFCRSLGLLERGGYPFDEIVSHEIPLDRVGAAFDALSGSYRLDDRDAVKIAVNPAL